MLKKVIKYVDYDDVQREETFNFHLTKAELAELELGVDGGLTKLIQTIIATQDQPKLIELFKKILLLSYGEKSPDGRRFMKSDEIRKNFSETEAYSIMFMELCTDDKAAAEFIKSIIPSDIKVD